MQISPSDDMWISVLEYGTQRLKKKASAFIFESDVLTAVSVVVAEVLLNYTFGGGPFFGSLEPIWGRESFFMFALFALKVECLVTV